MSQLTIAAATGSRVSHERDATPATGLLCVANFPANTGFAWEFIESLYAGVADRLAEHGVQTWVAYPQLAEAPRSLAKSAARPVELEVRLGTVRCVRATLEFVRKHNIKAVYLADRASWHPAYLAFRLAGVRRIVVHDHTSGERTPPTGVKKWAKLVVRRGLRPMLADVVIGVSEYVVRRKKEVDLVPPARVRRIWNSLPIPTPDAGARARLRRELGLTEETPVVVCACRASLEKGVEHLLYAFEQTDWATRGTVLVFMGSGPDLERLQRIRRSLRARDQIIFTGYRTDAAQLIEGADIAVVPSLWQEAFGLSALEPMARGVPVIASRVGGIPEVVVDGETGVLVRAGDEVQLASTLQRLLGDAAERTRLGENGRTRAATEFAINREVNELTELFEPVFAVGSAR